MTDGSGDRLTTGRVVTWGLSATLAGGLIAWLSQNLLVRLFHATAADGDGWDLFTFFFVLPFVDVALLGLLFMVLLPLDVTATVKANKPLNPNGMGLVAAIGVALVMAAVIPADPIGAYASGAGPLMIVAVFGIVLLCRILNLEIAERQSGTPPDQTSRE